MKYFIKVFIIIFCVLYALSLISDGDKMINIDDLKNIPSFNEDYIDRYIKYARNNIDLSVEEIVKRVNVNLDINFYENAKEALNKDSNLILVNKHYYLNENYIPDDLVLINYKYTSGIEVYAKKEATHMFELMCTDASAIGLIIKTISSYRSYNYQKNLYEKYLLNDPKEIVDTYSARSGHSEHQTGLAFDLYNVIKPYTLFGETKEYEWLKINAHKYGFIIRYTKDNEYITGYKDEPWHIRYVGIDNATYIYENNITLEEFILNNKN